MKKNTTTLMIMTLLMMSLIAEAQNVATRTNEFEVDYSDPKKLVNTTIAVINWISPAAEVNYVQDGKFRIKFEIESTVPIKSITISIKDDVKSATRGMLSIQPEGQEQYKSTIEKSLTLMEGDNLVEITTENMDGSKTISSRKVTVGDTGLADASKLKRTDYAILFATDNYDNWSDLVNPVFDTRAIAEELSKNYGFKVEVVENATQSEILKKIREYGERKYEPLDQLFIFFAGHGTYDQTFGEGFVVTRESLVNDEGKTSFLSHNRLRSIVNNIPCDHIFLAMDVCFGGTFDQVLASSRGGEEEVYKEQGQAEFITRKLTYKTRRFLTSGGKTYVSDGIKGKHSPFAKTMIESLRSRGGKDGILTLADIYSYVEKLKNPPRMGEFGDNAPGSDFIFIAH